MEINIVCVGNLKETFFVNAVKEYQKRITAFSNINIIEVKESNLGKDSEGEILINKQKEALELEKYKSGYTIALEIDGKSFSSTELATKIQNIMINGNSKITFFIGGSNGLDKKFSDSLDFKLSFSKLTFPHQLMRVILLEQIYRSFTIINHKTYHK